MGERKKSNLGRILKNIKDESSKTFSVAAAINKACSDGITSSGRFSLSTIKRQLEELISIVSSDDFDRDAFFSEFNTLYSLVMSPTKRAKGVFHPSQLLDGCARQMVYNLSGCEYTDDIFKPVGAELQRTFDVGTWYHLYIQNILYSIGLLEQSEVPVVNREKYISGHADGVFKNSVFGEKVVLEIKTMNNWNFSKATFKPFKKHEFQASLYARELGAKKVLYLYINKDTSEIREFLVPLNDEQLEIADKKMGSVIEHVKNGTLPNRTCPDKFCDNALMCPFASLCFRECGYEE